MMSLSDETSFHLEVSARRLRIVKMARPGNCDASYFTNVPPKKNRRVLNRNT